MSLLIFLSLILIWISQKVNGQLPQFSPHVITQHIAENSAAGITVATLTCALDTTPCALIWVQNGDDIQKKFEVTGNQLKTTSNKIDYEKLELNDFMYKLTIIGTDITNPGTRKTGYAMVLVIVDPVNEDKPRFDKSSFQTTIGEDTKVGTEVLIVSASDSDKGTDGKLTFNITGGNDLGHFIIFPSTGQLFTSASLDYELTSSYNLTVTVVDGRSASETTDVFIAISNINDNMPQCSPNVFSTTLSANIAVGTTVWPMNCSDLDTGDALLYEIVSGDLGYFLITPNGELKIKKAFTVNQSFQSYSMRIKISDGSSTTYVRARISVNSMNKYSPVFSNNPNIEVNENTAVGQQIIRYTATDADPSPFGITRYWIHSVANGNAGVFLIEEESARIYLGGTLDYELTQLYEIKVAVVDGGGLQTTGTVTVSVTNNNDDSPSCGKAAYSLQIAENTPVGTILIQNLNCTDKDGDSLSYFLSQTPPDDTFLINAGTLSVKGALDHEKASFYKIQITVSDGSNRFTVEVSVSISDINEAAPVFVPNGIYRIDMSEDSPIGVSVVTVTAIDADEDRIHYSFTSASSNFIINSQNGEIRLTTELDMETVSSYQLQIVASDGHMSATGTVYISVQDVNEPPAFSRSNYTFTIAENSATGTSIGRVEATDTDLGGTNGQLQYQILSGNINSHFLINSDDGDISIAVPTDYESTNTFLLVIQVRDLGSPSLSAECAVTVDVKDINDNPPKFLTSTLSMRLDEDAIPGTQVIQVSASDEDSAADNNNLFTFSTDSVVPFKVNPISGIVTVDGPLDRESKSSFNMVINAVDKGTPPLKGTVTLIITLNDVNDNTPVIIGNYDASIKENVPLNYVVFQVKAYDNDTGDMGRMNYSIISGDLNSNFKIETTAGYLQVASLLDRETKSMYELVLQVEDNGGKPLSATVTATISVLDINDVTPVFTQSSYDFGIRENVPLGTVVGKISATDADEGTNAKLKYEIATYAEGHAGKFKINDSSGEILVNDDLDRESESFYSIVFQVKDGGYPALSSDITVNISVKDINDEDPVFQRSSYSTAILENLSVGSRILSVSAVDIDRNANSEIMYEIDVSTATGILANIFFLINSSTGDISLKQNADRETQDEIAMSVIAKDKGNPSRRTSANVTIFIEDINDNSPIFSPIFYNTEASYVDECGTILTKVTANDVDQEKNAAVTYRMRQSNESMYFQVHPLLGTLKAKIDLNDTKYIINVDAQDEGIPVMTSPIGAKIRIDSFEPNDVVISFYLRMNILAYISKEKEFIREVRGVIAVFYASSYVRRWCVEDGTSFVVVHLYAVKNDLTNWETNLNMVKPFMTNSELQNALKLDSNRIPTANTTGKSWNEYAVFKVEKYMKNSTDPTSWGNYDESSTPSAAVPLAVSLSLLALLIAAAILLFVALKKRWFRKHKWQETTSGPRVHIIEIKTKRNLEPIINPEGVPPNPEDGNGEDLHQAGAVSNIDSVIPDTNKSMTTTTGIGENREIASPSGVRLPMDADDKLVHGTPEIDGMEDKIKSSSSLRGVDPVTGWVYEENSETRERKWMKTPDGDPIFNKIPYV